MPTTSPRREKWPYGFTVTVRDGAAEGTRGRVCRARPEDWIESRTLFWSCRSTVSFPRSEPRREPRRGQRFWAAICGAAARCCSRISFRGMTRRLSMASQESSLAVVRSAQFGHSPTVTATRSTSLPQPWHRSRRPMARRTLPSSRGRRIIPNAPENDCDRVTKSGSRGSVADVADGAEVAYM